MDQATHRNSNCPVRAEHIQLAQSVTAGDTDASGRDFVLDLLIFHRRLNALVAIEFEVDRFEPEHLGKLNFYLEALDRDSRKAHENSAIGLLICASKDEEVVECAMSRSLSPALIAQYQTEPVGVQDSIGKAPK